jgi:hypothetical protein
MFFWHTVTSVPQVTLSGQRQHLYFGRTLFLEFSTGVPRSFAVCPLQDSTCHQCLGAYGSQWVDHFSRAKYLSIVPAIPILLSFACTICFATVHEACYSSHKLLLENPVAVQWSSILHLQIRHGQSFTAHSFIYIDLLSHTSFSVLQ